MVSDQLARVADAKLVIRLSDLLQLEHRRAVTLGKVAGSLTAPALECHLSPASRPDGRLATSGEESPGSMDERCRVMPGGGDPRESATENEPPAFGRGKGETVG